MGAPFDFSGEASDSGGFYRFGTIEDRTSESTLESVLNQARPIGTPSRGK